MKKLILAIFLLAVLVVVSYLKVYRAEASRDAAYDKGYSEAEHDLSRLNTQIDSLRLELGETEVAYAESLTIRESERRSVVDSLENKMDTLRSHISSLETDLTEARRSIQRVKKAAANQGPSKSEQVISYYKERYRRLPGDLSEYEKRVAVNEIRQETVDKFNISLAELKKIRSRYGIDY